MKPLEAISVVEEKKIVPVVTINNVNDAIKLGEALCEGGLPIAEITFRTSSAEGAIKEISKNIPEMLVGAGTVINLEQAKRALDAGAAFIVSPGINRSIIEFAIDNDIPIFPGVCTPTELMIALEYNLPVVKFFPAKQYGGLDTIKALAAPFPGIKFMPTGGINADNITKYLEFDRIIACGGSWMVKENLINDGEFSKIIELTKEALALVK
ncbi:bifunctional 4-hydroxy-2-oxoglutarate aldolase/2-dehydro-3-deoxy-phosphogluconate aldolase [Alloiococcus sp. CFN-8]|uniref:bifunctional 4-hydroxy-2-oxoglutarate aldolase/2-dehydro-3-deoxy-phosphogluconate aldolase n=1 Tax=Alloiococcus sp. CFN-8 TaxID=3416081 RepID=UPI003CFA334A